MDLEARFAVNDNVNKFQISMHSYIAIHVESIDC